VVLVFILGFLLSSCAAKPETRPGKPVGPQVTINLFVTSRTDESLFSEETISRPLAELRGAQLFFQEVAGAGHLNGVRFGYRLTQAKPPRTIKSFVRKESAASSKVRANQTVRPLPTPSLTVGRYVSSNPADQPAFERKKDSLPAASCSLEIKAEKLVMFSGLIDGAARKALRLLHKGGRRSFVLISDKTAYGQRGREKIEQFAEQMGMRAYTSFVSSGDRQEIETILKQSRPLPILAWLDPESTKTLVQAGRRVSYPEPIIFGPASVSPLLASGADRRLSYEELMPPEIQGGQKIFALGHKLAVADDLDERDPLNLRLKRFRERYRMAFNTEPTLSAACSYDALLFMTESLVLSANPQAIASMGPAALIAMRERETFEGILGTYSFFAGNGSPIQEGTLGEDSFLLLRPLNKKWVPANLPPRRPPDLQVEFLTPETRPRG
jgi:hypothetical protein